MVEFHIVKNGSQLLSFTFVEILFIVSEEGSDFSAKVSDVAPLTLF